MSRAIAAGPLALTALLSLITPGTQWKSNASLGRGECWQQGGHACTGANTRTEVPLQYTHVDSRVGADECLS